MAVASYGDFSLGLQLEGVRRRIPLNGTIEVTRRCPLECQHCYNNLPMGDAGSRGRELTLQEHARILEEMAAEGCLWLLYTGGEIFARPDFLEIYTHARQHGMLVTLFTNGTLITPRIADRLAQFRPFAIEITLYGATQQTYEALTRIPGSYDRCMRGIRLLLERDLPLKLKTVAVSVNRHEIWAMRRLAEEEFGVDFKFDGMINPRLDCSQSPLAVRMSPEELVALDLSDPERVNEWTALVGRSAEAAATIHREEVYHCGGGVNSFSIDPYGRMSICVLSEKDKYDLRQGSFREGWEDFLKAVRHQKRTQLTKCASCALKSLCGMCPAMGDLENDDKEKPVDFLCRTAHLRAHAFGIDVPEHGDCEYCQGGAGYSGLLDSVEVVRGMEIRDWAAPRPSLFPMVAEIGMPDRHSPGCAGGGCGACASAPGQGLMEIGSLMATGNVR